MLKYQYRDSTGSRYEFFRSDRAALRWFKNMRRDTHSQHAVLFVWEAGVPVQIA